MPEDSSHPKPRALIFDGSDPSIALLDGLRGLLMDLLQAAGWDVTTLALHEMDIPPCCGMFACWVKTPGQCASGESCQQIAGGAINTDLLVFLTPVVFGGYSSQLKKAIDHLIPNISPFMLAIHHETRHEKRYDVYPALLAVGFQPRPEPQAAALFNRLVERNVLSLYSPVYSCVVVSADQSESEQRAQLAGCLAAVGTNR